MRRWIQIGLSAACCGVWVATLVAQEPAPDAAAPPAFERGVVIPLEGVILPRTERFLNRKLERARQQGADLVVLQIASPGGALDATLNLATTLRDIDWARTVAYIPEEALSGAAIVALACDEIVMGPQARLGDAGPVFAGPDALFRHAPEKIRSDLARRVRDLAEFRGRPPALAEAMVDKDLEVFRVVHRQTGEVTYRSQPELDALADAQQWEKGPLVLESRAGSFLEVNGDRAVELQLADATVGALSDVEQRYALRAPLLVMPHNWIDKSVDILNLPLVTAALFVIGAIALYIELGAPGVGMGGLVAGLCFALFFWSRFLGGTADWLEVILVLGGLAFLALELFVLPGFGVAGITGLVLMVVGIVMAGQNRWVPQSPRAFAQLATSLVVLCGSGVVSLLAFAWLSRVLGTVPVLQRLILRAPSADGDQEGATHAAPLAPVRDFGVSPGDRGIAESPLRPAGRAVFGTVYLDVVSDGSYIDRGRRVQVVEIHGNRVLVREIEPE
ncbi:MAG: peptidase [Pirellulaceae bacterium]|jgi:membrane-bound serine protease (ClpP class)|nr:peptidase [Pirellulaceae bacterium]